MNASDDKNSAVAQGSAQKWAQHSPALPRLTCAPYSRCWLADGSVLLSLIAGFFGIVAAERVLYLDVPHDASS